MNKVEFPFYESDSPFSSLAPRHDPVPSLIDLQGSQETIIKVILPQLEQCNGEKVRIEYFSLQSCFLYETIGDLRQPPPDSNQLCRAYTFSINPTTNDATL